MKMGLSMLQVQGLKAFASKGEQPFDCNESGALLRRSKCTSTAPRSTWKSFVTTERTPHALITSEGQLSFHEAATRKDASF